MNSIRQIDNIIPEAVLSQVEEFVANAPYKYGWPSNKNLGYSHWNYTIAPGGALNGLEIAHTLPPLIAQVWQHLQQQYLGEQTLIRCYTNAHTFGVEGYPHTDSIREHDHTVVIYMNPEWRREWGGETMLYSGDTIVHAELPKFNKGLIFKGNQFHTARSVSRICPELRRTLMFKFAPKNIDTQRDKIQQFLTSIGADQIVHNQKRGTKLSNHLLGTYDLLKSNGHLDHVCAAGGLHSIFGTNIFKQVTVDIKDKDIIANLVGPDALELIELFHYIQRPDTLETAIQEQRFTVGTTSGQTITLTPAQLANLSAIEAANLSDQGALKKYPGISRFFVRNK